MNKRPLVIGAIVFLLGILWKETNHTAILIMAVVFILWHIWWRFYKRGRKHAIYYLIAFLIIFSIAAVRAEQEQSFREAYLSRLQNHKSTTIYGSVYRIEQGAQSTKIYLKDSYVDIQSYRYPCNYILVYLTDAQVSMGSQIQVTGTIQLFERTCNEGNFDACRYYQCQQIDFCVYAKEVMMCENTDTDRDQIKTTYHAMCHKIQDWLYQRRQQMKEVFRQAMGARTGGVLSTMLLSDKEYLDAEVKQLYQQTGISHILAISGLHISMIGMGLYHLLEKLRMPIVPKYIMSVLGITFFSIMIGGGVSTQRAVYMFYALMLGRLIGRSYDLPCALSFAAICLLFKNPFIWQHSGFQLSFLAVIGVYVTQILSRKYNIRSKGIRETCRVSIGIQVFTLPLIAWNYYEIPIYSVLVNVVILPFAGVVLACGICGGILGCLNLSWAWLPLQAARFILQCYEKVCEWCTSLPMAGYVTGRPTFFGMAMYYFILIVAVCWMYYREPTLQKVCIRRWDKFISRGCVILLTIILWVCLQAKHPANEINMLDVGQGEAIHIAASKDMHLFIDGGSTDEKQVGQYRILPYLKCNGIAQIDYWFVTHCDSDHISGLMELLDTGYEIENLVLAQNVIRDDDYEELVQLAETAGTEVLYVQEGDTFCLDKAMDGLLMEVIYAGDTSCTDKNENSLVLMLTMNGYTGVLTGDIGSETEQTLIQTGTSLREVEKLDWYKVAHHGSQYSNSEEMLAVCQPSIALISCGADNRYGHPHAQTLQRLNEVDCQVYTTAECGQVTLQLRKDGIRLTTREKPPN